MRFTPHDEIAPGLWYLRVDYKPYFTVVSVLEMQEGPIKGELAVWSIGEEDWHELGVYDDDQFIGPVISPF